MGFGARATEFMGLLGRLPDIVWRSEGKNRRESYFFSELRDRGEWDDRKAINPGVAGAKPPEAPEWQGMKHFSLAGFWVTTYGRIWVITEVLGTPGKHDIPYFARGLSDLILKVRDAICRPPPDWDPPKSYAMGDCVLYSSLARMK
jgi:hypothetical protein